MAEEYIVAIGLLTRSDIDRLGASFSRLYPVAEAPGFGDLLAAIDEADRAYRARQDRLELPPARAD